jgi:RNA polymerase sigma factor (sigma-70 family)
MVSPAHEWGPLAVGKQNVYMKKNRASTLEECREILELSFNDWFRLLGLVVSDYFQDDETIKDIVSELFEKIWYGINEGSIGNEQLNSAYFRKMAKNACLDRIKELKRNGPSGVLNRDVADVAMEEKLDEKGLAEFLSQSVEWIEGLPEQQRRVMTAIFFEGRKPLEVANALGLSRQTVYRHRDDALETIRKMAKERGMEFDLLPLWWLSFFSYLVH